jgi:hypothetical protein
LADVDVVLVIFSLFVMVAMMLMAMETDALKINGNGVH